MGDRASIAVTQLQLVNFRCFSNYTLDFDAPYVYIEGINGAGKTSILEALYYSCYLRSFRTHLPKELITFGKDDFFIKLSLNDRTSSFDHSIQIGFSPLKRLVKVDQKTIDSYRELFSYYRVISVTEDDLLLVQSSPHIRRLALDQLLVLLDPEMGQLLKKYKNTLEQRNALLQGRLSHNDLYQFLTQQLWDFATAITLKRITILEDLDKNMRMLSSLFIPDFETIQLIYQPKRQLYDSFQEFQKNTGARLYEQEIRFGRTLFGPHLDDIAIIFQDNHSRLYASRGQQKMIVILFKMAKIKLLSAAHLPAICLLDDFMTDFDPNRAHQLILGLANMGSQLIFTSPLKGGVLGEWLTDLGGQSIKLTM